MKPSRHGSGGGFLFHHNLPRKGVCKITTTNTLESVISTIHEQSASHFDQVVGVQDMRFASLEQMTIDGQSFGLLPSAQRLLANRLRVPFSSLAGMWSE